MQHTSEGLVFTHIQVGSRRRRPKTVSSDDRVSTRVLGESFANIQATNTATAVVHGAEFPGKFDGFSRVKPEDVRLGISHDRTSKLDAVAILGSD